MTELQLKGLADCKENWSDIDSIDRVFCSKRTDISGTSMSCDFTAKRKFTF